MAYRIRGGGEQNVCSPASGMAKRAYYAEDDTDSLGLFPLDQDKRRRLAYDTDHKHAHLIYRPPAALHVPDCDIPFRSIEPRDSHTPVPTNSHAFYILYEEGLDSTSGRLHLQDRLRDIDSRSPLPPAARDELYPAVGGPKQWANGAHLRTSDMDAPYFASPPSPAHSYSTPPRWAPRYKDWREQNCAYDVAADEESRSFSPFVMLPPPAEPRHTPEILISAATAGATAATATSRLHYQFNGDRGDRDDFDAPDDHERDVNRHKASLYAVRNPAGAGVPHSCASSSDTARDESSLAPSDDGTYFVSDDEAADNVTANLASFMRRYPTSRQERILRSLIHPKSASGMADFELDDDALDNILRTANDLFFGGRLRDRVLWDWSGTNSDPQYDSKIIGHTSLRLRKKDGGGGGGGIETFVLLSTPILKNRAYSRRLLISAFLHELVHCYLFICCGWKARKDGGHTDGFRRIADTIDKWAGRDNLFLCQVEADLEQFRQAPRSPLSYVLDQSRHECRPAVHYGDQDHPEPNDWWMHRRHGHEWA